MQARILRVGAVVLVLAAPLSAQILFAPAQSTALPLGSSGRFAVGDLNGDTWADLVVGNELHPAVRLGDGAGHFGAEALLDLPAVGTAVALADLTGDGVLDLLVGTSREGILYVSRGLGDGSFEALTSYPLGVVISDSVNYLEFAIGDLDQDGDSDVLALTKGGPGAVGGEARIFRNTGAGALVVAKVLLPALGGLPFPKFTGGRFASLNGDEFIDLVLDYKWGVGGTDTQSKAFLGVAADGFAEIYGWQQQSPVAFDDFDGDGTVDSLFSSPTSGVGDDELLTWLPGQGDGTFTLGLVTVLPAGFVAAGVGRLDDDDVLDVAVTAAGTGDAWFLHGNGDGSFAPPTAHVTLSQAQDAGTAVLADCDGDGRLDLVAEVAGGAGASAAVVTLNRTYAASGPLLDLGHQLEGGQWPIQIAAGSFVPTQPFSFQLSCAPANGVAFLVVGFLQLNAPFKGGTMVPLPRFIMGPWPVSPSGTVNLAGLWPASPSGLQLVFQFWVPDAAGPAGFAASSGVQVIVP